MRCSSVANSCAIPCPEWRGIRWTCSPCSRSTVVPGLSPDPVLADANGRSVGLSGLSFHPRFAGRHPFVFFSHLIPTRSFLLENILASAQTASAHKPLGLYVRFFLSGFTPFLCGGVFIVTPFGFLHRIAWFFFPVFFFPCTSRLLPFSSLSAKHFSLRGLSSLVRWHAFFSSSTLEVFIRLDDPVDRDFVLDQLTTLELMLFFCFFFCGRPWRLVCRFHSAFFFLK